jgi:hypothetical protein
VQESDFVRERKQWHNAAVIYWHMSARGGEKAPACVWLSRGQSNAKIQIH